ncbi:hypothetical protein NQ318_022305 [Aromia moschata]|uniref:Uncharacterized protein n=1 Tax=Aromia moschata TaxID=1265417 RepID=A0AAV8Z4H9_9CUCU|nr:hypothetical protein NQ318_022305 [Aromia moschata]
MASRQVFLKDLKVADLKRELEERECETTGKKADLQNRLKEALENEGENPDIFLFEIAGDINSALQSLKGSLEQKLIENGSNLEQKFEETSGNLRGMEQNLRGMEQRLVENATQMQQKFEETSGNLRGMEQKLMENHTTLEKKITENSSWLQKQMDGKFGEIENKLVTVEEEFQNKFLEMERKFATLVLEGGEQQRMINTSLKSPGSDIDRMTNPQASSHMEMSKIRMKPPQFDGKSSWVNYLRQFEAAAKANGWSLAEKATALTLALRGDATDILQTLSLEEQEDYHQLVRHLEMRYGQSHLEHVYHSQLKNRYQKSNESLQEFEADIARLVRLAYSSTPENVMERLAVQAFLDGLRDTETRQALTLARPSKLVDALARALEFEAAKQSCRGQAKVRRMEDGVEEGTCNEAEIRRVVEGMLEKRQIRCWNCDTGATRTIIRPDIVGTAARITSTSWRLRTATGDPATIRGETNVTIVIGNVSFEHRALVAEIEDELILGMDIMNTKGFELDFKNNVLKINGEEIVLHRKTEETIRVVLAEDTAVPERSEMILDAHLDGNPCVGNIMMFEPRSHDGEVARGIAVGKSLLLTEKTVPVRIMNLNHHPVNLRKGIVLGYCSSVSSVIQKLDAQENSVRKITGELANLLSSSSRSLRSDQTTKLRNLITKYADIFDDGQGGKGRTNKEDRKPTWEEVSRYSPTVKSYWAQWNSLVLSDGLLKRVLEKSDGTEERKQLIVPRNRVPEVLEEIHNGSTGGHLGVTKTLGKVRERFYWVNCTTDVKEWCKKCVVCAASNGPQRHPKAPMRQYNVAYRSSIHETTGQTPASIVMGRELRLPCDLKFGCTPGDDVAGEDYVSTLRQRMDDIHERVRSNIQGASDRMKETYDINANDGRYQPGNQVWLYNPQRRRGLSPKLQSSWEGPYEVVTRINDVVYRIQELPRGKPRVVHFNRLAPFAGNNDEQAEARVRHVSPPDSELSFEEFMLLHSNGQKARYGVTREEPRDLFQAPADFCLAHCVAADLRMSRGIALTFKKAFGQLEELRRQRPEVGRVLQITAAEQEKERSVFYLVTKQLSHHKPTYQTVWDTLVELRDVLLSQSISSLAIPKIASGLDGLDWRVIRSMLEVLFRFTGIEILVCCYNPRRSLNEKTVDCFFYQTSRCKNGPFCRYRHRPGDDTIRDEMSLRRGQCYGVRRVVPLAVDFAGRVPDWMPVISSLRKTTSNFNGSLTDEVIQLLKELSLSKDSNNNDSSDDSDMDS